MAYPQYSTLLWEPPLITLELKKLYERSFESSELKEHIRQLQRPIRIDYIPKGLRVQSLTNLWQTVNWMFKDAKLIENEASTDVSVRDFNGMSLKFYEAFNARYTCYTDVPELVTMIMINYLQEIFVCELFQLHIPLREVQDLELYLRSPLFQSCKLLIIEKGAVTHSEMAQILAGFPKAQKKKLLCYPGRDFVYDKKISVASLTLAYSQWVSSWNLANLESHRVKLANSNLVERDFNDFIINWLINHDKDFEYLCVRGKKREPVGYDDDNIGFEALDMGAIVDGIETTPFVMQGRLHQTFAQYRVMDFFADGLDILGPDGSKATVLIKESLEGCQAVHFVFVVWKRTPVRV